jgi:hypothetical protein
MNPTRTTLVTLCVTAAVAMPATAEAGVKYRQALPAKTTVTIQAEGTDLSGTVSSKRQRCVTDRKVIVIKIKGTRGGGDDKVFASDTADADGSWNTGNTGTEGRFYAKVRRTAACRGDESPTVRATR